METVLLLSSLLNIAFCVFVWYGYRNYKQMRYERDCYQSQVQYAPDMFSRLTSLSPLLIAGAFAYAIFKKIKIEERNAPK